MGLLSRIKGEATTRDQNPAGHGTAKDSVGESGPTTFRAIWNGEVVAESSETIEIEGNQYFPRQAVNGKFLAETDQTTVCPWKGTAAYYDVVVDGEVASEGAWYYPAPKDAVPGIKDRIAFWRGVTVEEV